MTRTETAQLMAVLAAAYPKFNVDELKIKVWYEMLSDISYQVANAAAKKCIVESIFPPSIAEIRKAASELVHPDSIGAPEAWGMVLTALTDYGFWREKEALESLPPEVSQVVKWMGWREVCHTDNLDVIRGQFIKMYQTNRKRERDKSALPEDLKRIIEGAVKQIE